jgi:hypothetical protein
LYLKDLPFILQESLVRKKTDKHLNEYQNFIRYSLSLLMKENLESKAQIYGVYWSYETVLSMIWSVVRDNIDRNNEFFIYQDFMNRLASAIKTSDCYKDPEFRYVPKEDLVGCVMTVFYELFWPSLDNIKKWENSVQVTFR